MSWVVLLQEVYVPMIARHVISQPPTAMLFLSPLELMSKNMVPTMIITNSRPYIFRLPNMSAAKPNPTYKMMLAKVHGVERACTVSSYLANHSACESRAHHSGLDRGWYRRNVVRIVTWPVHIAQLECDGQYMPQKCGV
jgi:hypothetical protein